MVEKKSWIGKYGNRFENTCFWSHNPCAQILPFSVVQQIDIDDHIHPINSIVSRFNGRFDRGILLPQKKKQKKTWLCYNSFVLNMIINIFNYFLYCYILSMVDYIVNNMCTIRGNLINSITDLPEAPLIQSTQHSY